MITGIGSFVHGMNELNTPQNDTWALSLPTSAALLLISLGKQTVLIRGKLQA